MDWIRQRAGAGDDPNGADALDCARAAAGALAPDGMADGQVALYGESGDGQHGGVGGGLHEERLEQAELHAEVPGVGLPDREQFRRKCWKTERIKDLLKRCPTEPDYSGPRYQAPPSLKTTVHPATAPQS